METTNKDQSSPKPDKPVFVEEKTGNKNKVIIGILAALLLTSLFFIYNGMKNQDKLEAENEITREELVEASGKLEAISIELDEKIAEIESLGGDITELQQAKEEVEKEKEALRKSGNIKVSRLREKVKGYESLLKAKDVEIDRLKQLNDSLFVENTGLKVQQNEMQDAISSLEEDKGKLEEKVSFASRLKAQNIKIYAVNKRGKEREGPVLRSRQIAKLKVTFSLAENNVAPIEGKEIVIRVIDQDGKVIFDVAKGSGTFMYNGKEEFFTAKQDILFDNSKQNLTYFYEKSSEFVTGKYTMEAYTDGYLLGLKSFTVK